MERQPRRVNRDYARLVASGPSMGIWIKPAVPDQIDAFVIMLRGPEGPYEDVLYFFTLEPWVAFNPAENSSGLTYPATPPRVLHVSPWSIRSHPNLYRAADHSVQNNLGGGAKVCLSMLNTWAGPPWSAMTDFESIFVTILSILDDDPLRNEPSYENGRAKTRRVYAKYVQYCCLRETMTKIIMPTLDGTCKDKFVNYFADEIKAIWAQNRDKYISKMQAIQAEGGIVDPSDVYYGDKSYVGSSRSFQDILDSPILKLEKQPEKQPEKQ